jgi:hypothetical protein
MARVRLHIAIARQLGLSRGVIYHWLRTGQLERDLSEPQVRRSAPRPTKLDPYHLLIQERLTTYPEKWRPREHTVPHRCLESPANYINEMPPRRLRTSLGSSLPRRGGRAAVPDRPEIRIRFELEARG